MTPISTLARTTRGPVRIDLTNGSVAVLSNENTDSNIYIDTVQNTFSLSVKRLLLI